MLPDHYFSGKTEVALIFPKTVEHVVNQMSRHLVINYAQLMSEKYHVRARRQAFS